MQPNPGQLPDDCLVLDEDGILVGHRHVHVILFNGWDSRKALSGGAWPSSTTRWQISRPPHPGEVKFYEVA